MIQTLEQKRAQPPDPAHFAESSARENLIEHVFLGELLRGLWRKNVRDLEVLRPEVDSGGYDLALDFRGMTRHMQLKSSFTGARRSEVTASVKLLERPPPVSCGYSLILIPFRSDRFFGSAALPAKESPHWGRR